MDKTEIYNQLLEYALANETAEINFEDFMNSTPLDTAAIENHAMKGIIPAFEIMQMDFQTKIDELLAEKKIHVQNSERNKVIILPEYYLKYYEKQYEILYQDPALPYPHYSEIRKKLPENYVTSMLAHEYISQQLDKTEYTSENGENLYILTFEEEAPSILLPPSIHIWHLVELSLEKIRVYLRNPEKYDYIRKKLISVNAKQEMAVKYFFEQFVANSIVTLENIKLAGDLYFMFTQLFKFIRVEIDQLSKKTKRDISVVQASFIAEFTCSYFRNKQQIKFQRANTIKLLEEKLQEQPYYFSYSDILNFTDENGNLFVTLLSEEYLSEYLKAATTEVVNGLLPSLLVFKVINDEFYYASKRKALTLISRLCYDAREPVRKAITADWYKRMYQFVPVPEMKNQKLFEMALENQVKKTSPVFYSLLQKSFVFPLYYEMTKDHTKEQAGFKLYSGTTLLPYSSLLLLSRKSISIDAMIQLPFWRSIPILSFAILFFMKIFKKQPFTDENPEESVKKTAAVEEKKEKSTEAPQIPKSKKSLLQKAASMLEKKRVDPSTTIDMQLELLLDRWNTTLGEPAKSNLTEDVNAFIRDFLRKQLRLIHPASFSNTVLDEYCEYLVTTNTLQQIKNKKALSSYCGLYILKQLQQ